MNSGGRGGGGEAKELQGAEVKRIWGLVEGGANSVVGESQE